MAGSDPRFNEAQFRDGIHFAMRMGAATWPEGKAGVTFHFKAKRSYQFPNGSAYSGPWDQEGRPLHPDVKTVLVRPQPLTIEEVAVEFEDARPEELPVGVKIPTRVVLTMLDSEYQAIKDRAATVVIGGVQQQTGEEFAHEIELADTDRYRIAYRKAPLALFGVGVRQLVAYALEES